MTCNIYEKNGDCSVISKENKMKAKENSFAYWFTLIE